MAGSRRSPILRDQWSADPDRDPRERERRRGRGPGRDRGGRSRGRDRGRPYRPNNRNYDRPGRSPPRASRFGPDFSHDLGDLAPSRSPPRGSPGPPGLHNGRRRDSNIPVSAAGDWNARAGPFDREVPGPRRDESPSGPPSKRQRTRSPSTYGRRGPLLPRVRIIPNTSKDGIEALHSRSEVAARRVVALRDDDHLAAAETDAVRTVAVQTSRAQEDLYHRVKREDFIPRPIGGLVAAVVTITATVDLTIGQIRGTLCGLQTRDIRHLLAGRGVIRR
ncbi:uncharacterized protein N7515_000964 [Penicillium bovifimosum]|uniref:Uncharacterized protein n=1 Tax=Penicillium bovifimosum TaxID=126998 RepID=A0A9W9HII8_9EURO|nr:uncharacterized protein N7515_000964 [Penicillium bovifimosum]KAJ5146400.1 hypothetical protein N7515_000964 [Penicillium bovifimosum]